MGNTLFNNRIQDEEEGIKLYLELKQTKLQLNQNLKGKVIFRMPSQFSLGTFDLNLKIYGHENATYNFKEKNKSVYKYSVKDHQFYKKTISLVQNEKVYAEEYHYVTFDWNTEVSIPSLEYKYNPDLTVSREYQVVAILIWKNQKNQKIPYRCHQPVLFYIDSDEIKQQTKQMRDSDVKRNQKVDAITTYKWLRQHKGLVFVSFEADKCIYFNGDYLNVTADVDNTFGYLKIQSAKLLFYLEFIIKEKWLQGMPKILLCEEKLEQTDQNKYFGKMNFQLNDRLNLPYQSVSERIGCRYIVVLQLIFEQLCLGSGVDNVEFILPYMEYYKDNRSNEEPQQQFLTEIKNIENQTKFMDAIQNLTFSRPTNYIRDQDFLMNRQTRVAQQTQILIMKE
ncbi:unnamed protein product [Paramecium primaurelia]|uniref:Uncharacterized protein n=1 Tax=Paramecium primaurelia TaxID=5886 RepID=A0A8S1KEQ6_PARPR|nr:unnamed protein product [Paramecium primaurelia]